MRCLSSLALIVVLIAPLHQPEAFVLPQSVLVRNNWWWWSWILPPIGLGVYLPEAIKGTHENVSGEDLLPHLSR